MIILLGPQSPRPNLGEAVELLSVDGPFCVVTAGWQERSGETEALAEHLGRKLINLKLYERAERVFAEDPEFFAAHRRRQDRLRKLQGLYRLRLAPLLRTARRLFEEDANSDPDLLQGEQKSALEMVRILDRHHLTRLRQIHAGWSEQWRPLERDSLRRERRRIEKQVADCDAVLIAGGHVAVLLNRARLFGLQQMIGSRPLVAWSAGAMAVSERVVLFHDTPPQGAGDAEILESGLGLARGVVALPHASRRLNLNDRVRVRLFARRFCPASAVTLDNGSMLWWNGDSWSGNRAARRLTAEGRLAEVKDHAGGD